MQIVGPVSRNFFHACIAPFKLPWRWQGQYRIWDTPQGTNKWLTAGTYSEAATYTYDVVSTLHDPCHRHHWRRQRRKERPRRGPPVMKGLRLSLRWLKTTHSTQQRRPSSTDYTPMSWRGDVTLPRARSGGGSPAMGAERERALWPTPTAVRQQLLCWA